MKTIKYNTKLIIESYDDNNICHVLAGPDYGQPWYYNETIELEEEKELVLENYPKLIVA